MNVAYVYGGNWPSQGAAGSFCTFTGYGLATSNKQGQVYLYAAQNTTKKPAAVLQDYYSVMPRENYQIKLVDTATWFGRVTKFYLSAFNKLRKLAKQGKIDAVITRKVGFLPYLYLLKKLYGSKIFFEAHNFYVDQNLKGSTGEWKKELFQKWFLAKVDGIITHQNKLKKLYQQYFPEQNYCVARTGIKEVTKVDDLWENNYLGYIGSLKARKRIGDIIRALSRIKDKNLKLLIIGGREQELIDDYWELARKMGVEDRVEITGWVSRQKVEEYLKKIKIGVVPLADTFFNRYLTSPMKIFNYFSHGVPIIGSDLPTIKEIVTDKGGLFYEQGNIDQLVKAINRLNSSQELFEQYSNYILDEAEELLWSKRGKKILEFIKQVEEK